MSKEKLIQSHEITLDSTDEERTAILSEETLCIVPWNRQRELYLGDPEESTSHALNRYMDEQGLRGKEMHFPDFEEGVRFSRTTLNESIRQMTKRHANLINLGKLLSVVDEVCGNAVKIEVEQYRHKKSMTANHVKQVHQYVSAFHDMANIYPVKITIHETEKKQRNRFYMVITVGEIEFTNKIKEAFTNTGVHSDHSEESLSAGNASSTIMLTEFISNFNKDEGIIIKNLPDGLLSEEQQVIKQKVLETDAQKEAKITISPLQEDINQLKEQTFTEEDQDIDVIPEFNIPNEIYGREEDILYDAIPEESEIDDYTEEFQCDSQMLNDEFLAEPEVSLKDNLGEQDQPRNKVSESSHNIPKDSVPTHKESRIVQKAIVMESPKSFLEKFLDVILRIFGKKPVEKTATRYVNIVENVDIPNEPKRNAKKEIQRDEPELSRTTGRKARLQADMDQAGPADPVQPREKNTDYER